MCILTVTRARNHGCTSPYMWFVLALPCYASLPEYHNPPLPHEMQELLYVVASLLVSAYSATLTNGSCEYSVESVL